MKNPNYFKMCWLTEPFHCQESNIFGGCTAQYWSTSPIFHATIHKSNKIKITLLTGGILFQKVTNDTPDSFHDNPR